MIRVSASTSRAAAVWIQAPELFDELIGTAIEVTSHEGVAMLTEKAPKGATKNLSLGFSVKSPIAEPDRIRGGIQNPTVYAYYADQGRKPGKMPPKAPIELWVRYKLGTSRPKRKPRKALPPQTVQEFVQRENRKHKRKKRQKRQGRTPRVASRRRTRHANLPFDSLVYVIRRSIGQKGTYAETGPPKFIEAVEKKLQPRLEYHVGNAVGELERRLSSR